MSHLFSEPKFSPNAAPRGTTVDSLTVGWSQPDEEMKQYVGYYLLSLTDPNTGDAQQAVKPAPASDHMFTELKPATKYQFMVSHAYSFVHVSMVSLEWAALLDIKPTEYHWTEFLVQLTCTMPVRQLKHFLHMQINNILISPYVQQFFSACLSPPSHADHL